MQRPKPFVLTIMDGWGSNPSRAYNAVAMAQTPHFDRLWQRCPHTLIRTDSAFVGLPEGQMGNSEVGHLNIGSGRIIQMDVTRLDDLVASGEIFSSPVLKQAMAHARSRRLHLVGLLSPGGVHAHTRHLYALLEMAKREDVREVFVHVITDGRDKPPQSGAGYVGDLVAKMRELGVGRIASLSGRYYAMDRDQRWERIEKAFRAMVLAEGPRASDPVQALQSSYAAGVTDEFVEPVVFTGADREPLARIEDHDAVIFFNYRADRARQLTRALNDPLLERPARADAPNGLHFVTMTKYESTWSYPRVLEPQQPENVLARVSGQMGWRNLRVAETEKYPHVTYFFNGGHEKPFSGEEREMVPSPRVATYDLRPEMSAAGVCDIVVKAIEQGAFDWIVVNFANADMVGHTGNLAAAIQAVETVDHCIGRIDQALRNKNGAWIITADHGNADLMLDPETGLPHTYHTTFPVPLILVSEFDGELRDNGSLRDIVPTLLAVLGAEKPSEMTGGDLRILAAS